MYFAQHLQTIGDSIAVLTVREDDDLPEQPKDEKLLQYLDPEIKIFRARVFRPRDTLLQFRNFIVGRKGGQQQPAHTNLSAGITHGSPKPSAFQELKNIITDSLSIPDVHIGWFPSAVRKGLQIIKTQKIDIIYATGAPWTSFLVGSVLRMFTKKPLILDFRDPWAANPSSRLDSQLMRRFEPSIERKVVMRADHIITNTEELRQDFLHRYPMALQADKITTITNGFEEYLDSQDSSQAQRLTLTHAGTLYFSRNPRCLLQAIVNTIENQIIPKEDLHVVFLGGIDVSIKDPGLQELIRHPLLQNVIEILPRRPYSEAIEYQRRSDVLLLIQPNFPLQIPRKLYEYMAFRKPILGITNSPGATAHIIRQKELGLVAENHPAEIEAALTTLHAQWKNRQLTHLSTEICDEFTNRKLTLKLHTVLQNCLATTNAT